MSPLTSEPTPIDANERLARRAMGLEAAACVVGGLLLSVTCGRVGRSLSRRVSVVAAAGVATTLWGGAVAVQSLAEDWRPPTRRAVAVNAAAGLVLLGAAAQGRGTAFGRTLLALAGTELLAVAGVQTHALVSDADGVARI